eukprot:jgi/Botrbrau1/10279/Bobra.0120s0001.1
MVEAVKYPISGPEACAYFRAGLKPNILEGEDEYEVEKILHHRKARRSYEFLVRWVGYSPEHDTWESEANLRNAPGALKEYWARVKTG